jgi:hypothetical protein
MAAEVDPLAIAKNFELPNVTDLQSTDAGNIADDQVTPISTEYAAAVPPAAIATIYSAVPTSPPSRSFQFDELGKVAAVQVVPFVEYAASVDPDLTAMNLSWKNATEVQVPLLGKVEEFQIVPLSVEYAA